MTSQIWWLLAGMAGAAVAFGRPRLLSPSTSHAVPAEATPDELSVRRRPALVSVIIPARNEEISLPLLLSDLAAEGRSDREVIVVDDHSTDRTGELARSFHGVTVVDAPDLPADWCGKPWACQAGVAAAKGDQLVFIDADVRVAAGAIDAVIGELERNGGLVSVQPHHAVETRVEHLSSLFNVIALAGAGAGAAHPTGAFGPVLATSRADYRTVGGHSAVRHAIVEDMALAANYRAAGLPVDLTLGGALLRFRMYPKGFRQLLEGWTKNFATGAGNTPPLRLACIVAWVTSLIVLSIAAIGAPFGAYDGSTPLLAVAGAGVLLQFATMLRVAGSFHPLTVLLLPVHVAFFLFVFTCSAYRTLVRRSVVWRGRTIDLRPAEPSGSVAA